MLDRKWRWVRGWREEAEWARGVCVCAHVYVYPSVCVIEKQGWLGGGGRRLSGGEVCVCVYPSVSVCYTCLSCVVHLYVCVLCSMCILCVGVCMLGCVLCMCECDKTSLRTHRQRPTNSPPKVTPNLPK